MSPTEVNEEVGHALAMLRTFTKHEPPEAPLGSLNPKAIAACKVAQATWPYIDSPEALRLKSGSVMQGVLFYHTKKVSLGLGFKWGTGFMITQKETKSGRIWSAPCFYKVQAGSLGISAGMSGIETMLIFGTEASMLKFVDGKSAKVGQDFNVVAISDLGLGNNDSIFNKGDAVALSTCNGVSVDWSLTGGSFTVDQDTNSKLYQSGVTPMQILSQSDDGIGPAQECQPLYDFLNELTAKAARDPRHFPGFQHVWSPQSMEIAPDQKGAREYNDSGPQWSKSFKDS